MTTKARMSVFLSIVLTVWTLMHLYVGWRLWNLPTLPGLVWHATLVVAGVALWVSFPLGQAIARVGGPWALALEWVGATWLGMLFLLLVALLAADLVTGFGWLLPSLTRPARWWALALAAGAALAALVQASRPPVITHHEVAVRGLDPRHIGLRLVQISDLHVGTLLGAEWLKARIQQVQALDPDLILVTGDLVERDAHLARPLVPILHGLRARLGVWGVTGNHEYYAGLDTSVGIYEEAGIRVLRDAAIEVAPGLVLAGVDDLSARRQFGIDGSPVERTLRQRPSGATIFLCHSPWEVERVAGLGVNLMLSGHTHAGQIWPFGHLVALSYPYLAGRYAVDGMTLIVSLGTGFWGPPMRLFQRSEIVVVTLAGSSAPAAYSGTLPA